MPSGRPGGHPPGPHRFRTCGFPAFGSFSTRSRYGMAGRVITGHGRGFLMRYSRKRFQVVPFVYERR